jgi:hypothetical protein
MSPSILHAILQPGTRRLFNTFPLEVERISCKYTSNSLIRFIKCASFWFFDVFFFLALTYKNKSYGVWSGRRGGHFVGRRFPVHRPVKWMSSHAWSGSAIFGGAPFWLKCSSLWLSCWDAMGDATFSPLVVYRKVYFTVTVYMYIYIYMRCKLMYYCLESILGT